MYYKEKVEYLSRYRKLVAQIEADTIEYERWLAVGSRTTQIFNAAPGGSFSSRVEKSGIELAGICDELRKEIQKAEQARLSIGIAINTHAKKPRYAELLRWRYMSGLTNGEIARIIKKDAKTVSKAMVRAIDTLDI